MLIIIRLQIIRVPISLMIYKNELQCKPSGKCYPYGFVRYSELAADMITMLMKGKQNEVVKVSKMQNKNIWNVFLNNLYSMNNFYFPFILWKLCHFCFSPLNAKKITQYLTWGVPCITMATKKEKPLGNHRESLWFAHFPSCEVEMTNH